jgi:hypothetical protein
MSRQSPLPSGRFNHPGNYHLLALIALILLLAASLTVWRVSAQEVGNNGREALEEAATSAPGDFVIAFMDSPSGDILGFNIRAGGFLSNSSRAFPEIAVRGTADDGPQLAPDIAADASGNFVIVWADDADKNSAYEILARGFNSDGSQRFSTMTVNTTSTGNQIAPAIAMNPNGDFVVVWQDDQDGNDLHQIHARGFDINGSQRFPTMTANPVATGEQRSPAVAMAQNGDFVVTWANDFSVDGLYNVNARGFLSDGSQRFPSINVNLDLPGDQRHPDIAMAPNGDFAITWEDDQDLNSLYQIHVRGFFAKGTQRFSTRTVNSVASGQQTTPFIAMANNGDFVVTWNDDKDGNEVYQVMARGFYRNGSEHFPDFFVNSVDTGQQIVSDIAMGANGDFVIPWQDDKDQNDVYQILARGFNSDGSQRFPDFTVNQQAAGQQWFPGIAIVRDGPKTYLPFVK